MGSTARRPRGKEASPRSCANKARPQVVRDQAEEGRTARSHRSRRRGWVARLRQRRHDRRPRQSRRTARPRESTGPPPRRCQSRRAMHSQAHRQASTRRPAPRQPAAAAAVPSRHACAPGRWLVATARSVTTAATSAVTGAAWRAAGLQWQRSPEGSSNRPTLPSSYPTSRQEAAAAPIACAIVVTLPRTGSTARQPRSRRAPSVRIRASGIGAGAWGEGGEARRPPAALDWGGAARKRCRSPTVVAITSVVAASTAEPVTSGSISFTPAVASTKSGPARESLEDERDSASNVAAGCKAPLALSRKRLGGRVVPASSHPPHARRCQPECGAFGGRAAAGKSPPAGGAGGSLTCTNVAPSHQPSSRINWCWRTLPSAPCPRSTARRRPSPPRGPAPRPNGGADAP
eukprot:scaffold187486_cov28-Tisochrysis_lutea.AAC.4